MNTNEIESILTSAGFGTDIKKCASCGNLIEENEFRNKISLREFKISGMCQKCQDSIFGED